MEGWGRSAENPVGGWYGLKKELRGRFGMYVPPVPKELGLAEVEANPRNNRMRAIEAIPRALIEIREQQTLPFVQDDKSKQTDHVNQTDRSPFPPAVPCGPTMAPSANCVPASTTV